MLGRIFLKPRSIAAMLFGSPSFGEKWSYDFSLVSMAVGEFVSMSIVTFFILGLINNSENEKNRLLVNHILLLFKLCIFKFRERQFLKVDS